MTAVYRFLSGVGAEQGKEPPGPLIPASLSRRFTATRKSRILRVPPIMVLLNGKLEKGA